MSALTFNGIAVPVDEGGLSDEDLVLGARGRAFSGRSWATERARKWTASGALSSTSPALVRALRAMLDGRGYGWSFSASAGVFADFKGLGPEAGNAGSREAGGKYGEGQLRVLSAGNIKWVVQLDDINVFSFGVWWKNGVTWEHWCRRRSYAASTWYLNGVAQGGGPAWCTHVNEGSNMVGIQLAGSGAGSDYLYSDMFISPATWPSTWPAVVAARLTPWPKPPYLDVTGDLVPDSRLVTCRGKASRKTPTSLGGTARLERLDFSLEED